MKSLLRPAVLACFVSLGGTMALAEGGYPDRVTKDTETQLTLAVILEAKPGKEVELREALTALLAPTRLEDGCIDYEFHLDPQNPGRFMFYENWESREQWDAHMETDHIKGFIEIAGDLIANDVDLTHWDLQP